MHVTVCSAIEEVCLNVGGYLLLPLVSIAQQLLLVVEQLLVCLCRELKVGTLERGQREGRGGEGEGRRGEEGGERRGGEVSVMGNKLFHYKFVSLARLHSALSSLIEQGLKSCSP